MALYDEIDNNFFILICSVVNLIDSKCGAHFIFIFVHFMNELDEKHKNSP